MLYVRNQSGPEIQRKAKSMLVFMFPAVLWVSATSVEYDLARRIGTLCSVSVSVFAFSVLLGALLRAPDGYEDEKGFRIGALGDAFLP